MIFTNPNLISNEKLLYKKKSNFIASVDEADLVGFFADRLMWLVGMRGKEAIGGHLYITNFRMIFAAHALNRFRGQFSIPLINIKNARREVRFPVYKIVIETARGNYEFVNWNVRDALHVLNTNKGEYSIDLEDELLEALSMNQPLSYVNAQFIPTETLRQFWKERVSDEEA